MDNQCTVQVKLELGHRAQLRKKPTTEGFTHDWMVFVRGPEQFEIQHFVEREEPKKVCFTYDLFLNLEGNPPVNHLRCEKLTFNNPTKEFRHKLIKAGGVTREHRERPRKDSESKASSRDPEREAGKAAKEPSKKHATENKGPKEEKPLPKAALKEAKLALKEHKLENASPKGAPPAPEGKPSSAKRPLAVESPKPMVKKLKKNSSKGAKTLPTNTHRAPNPAAPTNPANPTSSSSSSSYAEKKLPKEKGPSAKAEKPKPESEAKAAKKPVEVAVAEESNSEDEASLKSESAISSPSNSSSSSDSSSDSDFEPSQNHSQGPLRSMVEDLQSEESDDDDSSSGEEVAVKLSHSDSDTDNSADSCLPSRDTPPRQKGPSANNKVSGRKSPESCNKPEKILKKGTYDKAYTDELVELHRRLMALRERNVLQQVRRVSGGARPHQGSRDHFSPSWRS
ncbi:hypothetical protein E2320_022248 [Naja naja]|nr:hypothetical protein E2320_022248 [Naja naja]